MDPVILTEGISRCYKSGRDIVHALRNASITVNPGTFTILRGRSGSGKTTLLNLIGGLDQPDSGKIYFNGNEMTEMKQTKKDETRRKYMGFVFQSVSLISIMSAYENVEFALRVSCYDMKARRERVKECLDFVGLGKRLNHRAHELSGGEQQRVAIARAIAHRPQVVFADEPTAELDTHMSLQVMKVFRNLILRENLTIVMTSHDPNVIELADCVYTLQDGEIVSD